MFNVCFIVASMDKRIPFLEKCIKCFKESRYASKDIYLYYQGELFETVNGKEVFKDVVIDDKLRGVFTPRYELMKRFAKDYDYTILIDDDLFIANDTDYFSTIKFMAQFKSVGAASIMDERSHLKNKVDLCGKRDIFNVLGGMIFKKECIALILDYFKDKEDDYTFDNVWLLLYVFGYDLAKDFRSYAMHKTANKKINGEWTGFNWSRFYLPYKPFLTEYLNEPKMVFNPKRHGWERSIPNLIDINQKGMEMRKQCRLQKGF